MDGLAGRVLSDAQPLWSSLAITRRRPCANPLLPKRSWLGPITTLLPAHPKKSSRAPGTTFTGGKTLIGSAAREREAPAEPAFRPARTEPRPPLARWT